MNAKLLIVAATLVATALALPAAAQRLVVVEPVRADLDRDWLYEIKESRGQANAIREDEARRIAADMAASLACSTSTICSGT